MKTWKTKSSKDNLCKYCTNKIPTCLTDNIKFGDGVGNDNIIECSEFIVKSILVLDFVYRKPSQDPV